MQIAELGSLTRAAERLGIAQPSLSRQVRLLEQELGVTLFSRGARGMRLTDAGEALRLQISGPMRQIGHALYEVRSLPTEPSGCVALGMPPSFVAVLGARLAAKARDRMPNVSLRIVEGYSGHLFDWMKRGELDAAILYGPSPSGVNATRLLDDELVLVGATSVMPSEDIAFEELSCFPLVLASLAHGLRLAIDSAAAKAGTTLLVHCETDSYRLTLDILRSGEAFAILPPSAVQVDLASGSLSIARIVDPVPSRQVFVAVQSGAVSPRAVLRVEQMLRDEIAELAREGAFAGGRVLGVGDL